MRRASSTTSPIATPRATPRIPAAYADDVPVAEKCRYFINNHSEPRFFRDTERLEWREGGWPDGLGPAYASRIRLKHFQYRSPEQIEKRIETRRESFARGSFLHEQFPEWQRAVLEPLDVDFTANRPENAPTSWRDRVMPASLLHEDGGDGPYVVNEAALGPIPRWRPGWSAGCDARPAAEARPSSTQRPVKLAYIVSAYRLPDQLVRLLRAASTTATRRSSSMSTERRTRRRSAGCAEGARASATSRSSSATCATGAGSAMSGRR